MDGFHPQNVGRLAQGRAILAPCMPSRVIELPARERIRMTGKRAVVIGRPAFVTPAFVKPAAAVIDVGINPLKTPAPSRPPALRLAWPW